MNSRIYITVFQVSSVIRNRVTRNENKKKKIDSSKNRDCLAFGFYLENRTNCVPVVPTDRTRKRRTDRKKKKALNSINAVRTTGRRVVYGRKKKKILINVFVGK